MELNLAIIVLFSRTANIVVVVNFGFNIDNNTGTCHDIGSNKQVIWKHDGTVHTQRTSSSKESVLALFLEAKSNDF